jgi:hypothetical protein
MRRAGYYVLATFPVAGSICMTGNPAAFQAPIPPVRWATRDAPAAGLACNALRGVFVRFAHVDEQDLARVQQFRHLTRREFFERIRLDEAH